MKHLGCIVVLLFAVTALAAQNDMVSTLKDRKPGKGIVTLHQDALLDSLLGKPFVMPDILEEGEVPTIKMPGFRVQVYAGNNSRTARSEAQAMAEKVKDKFPDITVYTHFVNPRWLCQVGDFRSIEEADAVMRQLKDTGEFKEVLIVRGQINIPL